MGVLYNTYTISGLLKSYPFTVSSSVTDQSITVPYSSEDYILVGLTILDKGSYVNLMCYRNDYITGFYFKDTTVHFVRKAANYWAGNSATLYFLKI